MSRPAPQPMKFDSVDPRQADTFIQDDAYSLEQKLDGTRAYIVIRANGTLSFHGHGGRPLAHAAAKQHFGRIALALTPMSVWAAENGGEIHLDGEIITDDGWFYAFDLPYVADRNGAEITPATPYAFRRAALETLLYSGVIAGHRVASARIATGTEAKAALMAAVMESGAEGVMAKRLDSLYEPGKRVRHSVKIKLTKTADVVVTQRDVDGTKNAYLAVTGPDGALVPIGACSMIGKPDAQVGEVIEVEYLYLQAGGRLYQPRMLRQRPDKIATDCTMAQFPAYSRTIV